MQRSGGRFGGFAGGRHSADEAAVGARVLTIAFAYGELTRVKGGVDVSSRLFFSRREWREGRVLSYFNSNRAFRVVVVVVVVVSSELSHGFLRPHNHATGNAKLARS